MDGTVVIIMVLSGLCFLPLSASCLYILVPMLKNWTEAQSYCRSSYTDLAAVHTTQQLTEFNLFANDQLYVWLGLHADIEAWRWSLEKQDYYSKGEAEFRMWAPYEPDRVMYYQVCVAMFSDGKWIDELCSDKLPFICYQAGTQATSSNFTLVNQSMTWTDAQSYCRAHFTDLASVRSQDENNQLKQMAQNGYTWIGLYRDSWSWSDRSLPSITNWNPGHASAPGICMVSTYGHWTNLDCSSKVYFACYLVPVSRQVVRVVLEKTDSSVDMEELTEGILHKLHQRLKSQLPSEDVKLRWSIQANGKVFDRINMDTKDKETCPLL